MSDRDITAIATWHIGHTYSVDNPMESVSDEQAERQERDTSSLMTSMREFADDYGWSRVIEIAAWAMREQQRLIR